MNNSNRWKKKRRRDNIRNLLEGIDKSLYLIILLESKDSDLELNISEKEIEERTDQSINFLEELLEKYNKIGKRNNIENIIIEQIEISNSDIQKCVDKFYDVKNDNYSDLEECKSILNEMYEFVHRKKL